METRYLSSDNKLSRLQVLQAIKAFAESGTHAFWLVVAMGLVIRTGAHGCPTSLSLWTRDLPPEVDDSFACLVRTDEVGK